MIKGLVNILTPAYNSGGYIHRLLDSVLAQTYPKIEMFVIDDGSTDNTKEIVQNYATRFEARGYKLNYVFQENQGQSFATNNGLKLLNGEFLLWPDSDDWYKHKYSISQIISALESSDDDIGIARCEYEIVSEETITPCGVKKLPHYKSPENIFTDALEGKNGFFFEPGGYAIKLKFIDEYIPKREIFTSRKTGQNIQMLFPYLAHSKCITINDVLFCYLVRKTSHSHSVYSNLNHYSKVIGAHEENFITTLNGIDTNVDKAYFIKQYVIKQEKWLQRSALLHNDSKAYIESLNRIQSAAGPSFRSDTLLFCAKHSICFQFLRLYQKSRTMKKLLLASALIGSLFVNLLFITELYFVNSQNERIEQEAFVVSDPLPTIDEFQNVLIDGGLETLEGNIDICVPNKLNSFKSRIKNIYKSNAWSNYAQYSYSEAGYMMQALLNTALQLKDSTAIRRIKTCFDTKVLSREIERCDQTVYGISSLILYDIYGDKQYKDYADKCYTWLKERNTESFGVKFIESDTLYNYCDGIGVYNPFLVHYSHKLCSPEAYSLAIHCFEKYVEYGVERENGCPAQAFSIRPPYEKLGYYNWGRGFSWYTLGFIDLDKDSLCEETNTLVDKFTTYLQDRWQRDGLFTQFVGQSGNIDLSATLPNLYYLYKENKVELSEKQILEFSKHLHNKVMWNSSGVQIKLGGPYTNYSSSMRLSQAFMLNIISLYQARNSSNASN